MGARIYNISIKGVSSKDFPLKTIAKDLFNSDEYQENKPIYSQELFVNVGTYEEGIFLCNSQYMSEIMFRLNKELIKELYDYFGRPKIIMAYMICDFNCAAGYVVIEDGEVIRLRYYNPTGNDAMSNNIGIALQCEIESLERIKAKIPELIEYEPWLERNDCFYVDTQLTCNVVNHYMGYDPYWGPDGAYYHSITVPEGNKYIKNSMVGKNNKSIQSDIVSKEKNAKAKWWQIWM